MHIWKKIEEKLGVKITETTPVSGGCINETYAFVTGNGSRYFCKINRNAPPDFFDAEVDGLAALAQVDDWQTPVPEFLVKEDHEQALVLTYIEKGLPTEQYWRNLGKALARLHKLSHNTFGWKQDNYIGSLRQKNTFTETWEDFFITSRIEPLVKKAVDQGVINTNEAKVFNTFYEKIHTLFPKEKPALLHGDLWSGNVMPAQHNQPAIYDPAVYYGHREVDLAMTYLFGGFTPAFYQAYNEEFPLSEGFTSRKDFYNLYPLMVHVLLFGKSYWYEVEGILKRLK